MALVADVKFTDNKQAIEQEMTRKVAAWLNGIGQDAATTAANVLTETGTVDTGTLRNSISHAVSESEKAVYVGTNVSYAPYHEFGTGIYTAGGRQGGWSYQDAAGEWHFTKGVPAKHFLQFGATAHKDEYKAMLEQALKE